MTKVGGLIKLTNGAAPASAAVATRTERLWHLAVAALATMLLAAAMLLTPLDWAIWSMQDRLANRQPSGQIVYVSVDSERANPDGAQQREDLGHALDLLRDAGANRVFIDLVVRAPQKGENDATLRQALANWGDRLAFVDRIDTTRSGGGTEHRSAREYESGRAVVWSPYTTVWPNFAWKLPYNLQTSDGMRPTLAAALAHQGGASARHFYATYSVRSRSVPQFSIRDVERDPQASRTALAGKTVVVGLVRDGATPGLNVPGQATAPSSFVAINAAETLIRGKPTFVSGIIAVTCVIIMLAAGAASARRERRRWAYGLAVAIPLYLAVVSPGLNIRVELANAFPVLLVFPFLRWRANWKRRVASVDLDTGLPSVRSLIAELSRPDAGGGYVAVAKIHGYETLLRSLDAEQRATYVIKLVERLRVGDPKLPVYIDGHYLAWRLEGDNEARILEHLEGLRAIFAGPVTVGAQSIDVGITFGASPVVDDNGERTLASAIAAVEETSEAIEPIKLTAVEVTGDSLWDLSLRARIDAAMEAGEVFCVYQPKFDIREDRMVGVEALVRWQDPDRGFISPMRFVMQCEKAGRMEYLTRYVLQCACSAANLLHFRGQRLTMSVNISATLLNDMRIVGIVRNVLQATGFDPHYLMLEITETARIRDLSQARAVLKALKTLGTRISIDDFGVGAANFETLEALPFDEIKIDRQFVSQAATSPKARAIAASVVELGKSTRIAVVAEGAETASDIAILREIGCTQVQGFALSKPMPLTNLLNFLEGRQILSTG